MAIKNRHKMSFEKEKKLMSVKLAEPMIGITFYRIVHKDGAVSVEKALLVGQNKSHFIWHRPDRSEFKEHGFGCEWRASPEEAIAYGVLREVECELIPWRDRMAHIAKFSKAGLLDARWI